MKKLFLFSISCILSLSISAQVHFIGLQGGLNVSNTFPTSGANTLKNFRIATLSGLNYEVLLKNKYSIGVDVLFSQQGSKDEISFRNELNEDLGTETIIIGYDYVSIPLKFGLSFGDKLRFTPKVALIPSFLTSAKIKAEKDFSDILVTEYSSTTEKLDFAGMLEVALDYTLLENFQLYSSLSYRNSFTDYTANDSFSFDYTQYHYGIALSLGLKYRIAG